MTPYTERNHRRTRHYTHHYQYASASPHPSSPRMVANPVGDWLLEMVR
jgi:hypothetical protein